MTELNTAITESGEVGARPPTASKLLVLIEALSATLLGAVVLLLLVSVASRYLFSVPIIWIDEVTAFSLLWLAMLGAAIAFERGEHLRLTLLINRFPKRGQEIANTLAMVLVLVFLAALTPAAFRYVVSEWYVTSVSLAIPLSFRVAAIASGLVLMLAIGIRRLLRTARLGDLAACLALVVALALAGWLLKPFLIPLGQVNILIFLVGLVAACLALGVPIAFCFGLGALAFLTFTTRLPLIVMIGRIDEGVSSIILLSVPVFVLLGCILDATGMGKAIVNFLASLLGHVKAGMSYVLLGSLFLVSGISGSKVSDMATVAPALFPEMKRRGHRPAAMIALLTSGTAMADTVPPSIALIVLGSVAGVSIAALFNAGFAIAIVLLISLAVLARIKAARELAPTASRAGVRVIGMALLVAAPALVLPFLIRGLVGGGIATATEVATIAVLYAGVVGVFIYGGISPSQFYRMLVETAALTGAILIILGTAAAMAWTLTQTGFAARFAGYMTDLPGGWWTFMLVTIGVFLMLGCVLEGLPAVVLMAPIMFPIATNLGINEIHYSMVVITAMNIGMMTPPIGIGYYIACRIGNVSPDEAMGEIWPYLLALVVGMLIIAFVPELSTFFA